MDSSGELYERCRLQAFSDAVCSIVATILILPLQKSAGSTKKDFLEYLTDYEDLIIIYFVAFLLICSVWESHIARWVVISHTDDVLVWLNVTSLLFISFLPFAVRLVSQYTDKETPTVLSCGLLLVLELIEVAMIYYSFSQPKLLRSELRNLLPNELEQKRKYILKRKMLNPILYIAAAGLSFVNLKISWVLIVLVIISPCINRLVEVIIYKMTCVAEDQHIVLYENTIAKGRVECFTDGVYAIVTTLLVLDITSDNFPKKEDVNQYGLQKTLSKMWPEFITFIGTFVLSGLLWFVHHSLFCYIKNLNYLMVIVNNISLSCVGSLPLLTSLLNRYANDPHHTDKNAIQTGCFMVGTAGLCQFTIFTMALWNRQKYMSGPIIPVGAGSSRHNYLLIKLLLIPLTAVIVFCSSFSTTIVVFTTYHTLVLSTPLIFIIVKLIYLKIFRGQVVIMNVIPENQIAWSAHDVNHAKESSSSARIFTNS